MRMVSILVLVLHVLWLAVALVGCQRGPETAKAPRMAHAPRDAHRDKNRSLIPSAPRRITKRKAHRRAARFDS